MLTKGHAAALAERLELDVRSAGVCVACLTFAAFPLDLGHEREARREARKLTPILWAEGLELTTLLALETARRDGVADALAAIEDVRTHGAGSLVAEAIVWRLANGLVAEMRSRSYIT